MDWTVNRNAVLDYLKKYKFVILIMLAGIVLLMLPGEEEKKEAPAPVSQEITLQESLESILGEISGAGEVSVLLTQSAGEETIYQTDENTSVQENGNSSHNQTVLVSGSGREETGLVRKVKAPTYLGAVVVCQGADNASVRLAVVEAVRSATGLSTDRISVLKMK